jgi:hypothetical protein
MDRLQLFNFRLGHALETLAALRAEEGQAEEVAGVPYPDGGHGPHHPS